MKIRKGKIELTAAIVAALTLTQFAGIAADAETCMTQDLFLYVAAKKESAKGHRNAARSGEKTTGAGIAVLGTNNTKAPCERSKAKNERGEDRQKIAGRN